MLLLNFSNEKATDINITFPIRTITKNDYIVKLDQLKKDCGKNKYLIKKFELQSLIALSYYPELTDIEVQFIYSNTTTTMETRPTTNSVLKSSNRTYTIFVDNNTENEGIILDDVPFNAQIGIIAHELAHIVDYEQTSSTGIIGLGIKYLNKNSRPEFEKKIDRLTITKGFGWQLYDWSDYVLNHSKASNTYKDYKRKTYLTPVEIEQEIKANPIYNK